MLVLWKKLFEKLSIWSVGLILIAGYVVEESVFSIGFVGQHVHTILFLLTIGGIVLTVENNKSIRREIRIMRFEARVASLYDRLVSEKKKVIDNPYSVKEINSLVDLNKELKRNSFTKGRLDEMCSLIKSPLKE